MFMKYFTTANPGCLFSDLAYKRFIAKIARNRNCCAKVTKVVRKEYEKSLW